MNQVEFDAFGYGNTAESYGLDYNSAREATPQWYGVSWGNGNDGVSHMWPDYYVRTADPWLLAAAAVMSNWSDKAMRRRVADNCDIDGEREYTITACILDPPDDDDEESGEWECECGISRDDDICLICDMERPEQDDDSPSYCDANGAWRILEVFPIDDMDSERSSSPRYESLADCFSEADLKEGAAL